MEFRSVPSVTEIGGNGLGAAIISDDNQVRYRQITAARDLGQAFAGQVACDGILDRRMDLLPRIHKARSCFRASIDKAKGARLNWAFINVSGCAACSEEQRGQA